MPRISFHIEGGGATVVFASPGENLLDLARKANVVIDAPCSGNASCGKCRIRLLSGELESAKTIHLDAPSFEAGWRLACTSRVSHDAIVLVPDIASAYRNRIKATGFSSAEEKAFLAELAVKMQEAELGRSSGLESFRLQLDPPTLNDTMPDNERLLRALRAAAGVERIDLPYSVLKRLPGLARESGFSVRCICRRHRRDRDLLAVIDLQPGSDVVPACGLALDIGTTTVSALLVELEGGGVLAAGSAGNGQIRYGADVINRIIEQQKPEGIERLQRAIVEETLNPLIDCICRQAGVSRDRIVFITAAGNSVMNHLLLGVNANPLRTEPYIPAYFETDALPIRELGISLAPEARLLLAPNIGSYVGGDITAGVLASMMWRSPELSLLIDLGTNGEIVFGNSEFLVACACSAGPAFEGGDISCGMRATDGAIEACTVDEETMEVNVSVIGAGRPVGICGSGIIDLIAHLFAAGIVDGKGKFARSGRRIARDEFGVASFVAVSAEESASGRAIAITEVDIDNFVRAKGAVFAAIATLLGSLGFAPDDIAEIRVAGGIGSGINIANAIRIGMLPDLPLERYRYVGNSSLAGAYAMLVSEGARTRLQQLARSMTYLELSTQPGYMDAFVAACFLPHTNGELFRSVGAS